MKPLAIDLYCGLGGWSSGLLAEGYDCVGFDIEQHAYDGERYPAQLVLQDVRTLHGSQFKDAALIVASPPCQAYSYMAMPWTRAKAKAEAIRADTTGKMLADLNELFDACFRIQREACEAAGRHIPMVVENVRGAIPWVGRSRWNFGSYHLWGDLPALMPPTSSLGTKVGGMGRYPPDDPRWQKGAAFNPGAQGLAFTEAREARKEGIKVQSFRFDGSGRSFQTASVAEHHKGSTGYERTYCDGKPLGWKIPDTSSSSPRRKAASAKIAKIPFVLSSWIARVYKPLAVAA